MTRCAARTRAGNACTNPGKYAAADDPGALLCTQHAATAGDAGALAEQRARLAGHAAKPRTQPRRRRPTGDPVADQIAQLQGLAEQHQARGRHALAMRAREQLSDLLRPTARAQAEQAAAAPAAAPRGPMSVKISAILGRLTDSELAALKRCAQVAREIAIEAQQPQHAAAAPSPAQPADEITVHPDEQETTK